MSVDKVAFALEQSAPFGQSVQVQFCLKCAVSLRYSLIWQSSAKGHGGLMQSLPFSLGIHPAVGHSLHLFWPPVS